METSISLHTIDREAGKLVDFNAQSNNGAVDRLRTAYTLTFVAYQYRKMIKVVLATTWDQQYGLMTLSFNQEAVAQKKFHSAGTIEFQDGPKTAQVLFGYTSEGKFYEASPLDKGDVDVFIAALRVKLSEIYAELTQTLQDDSASPPSPAPSPLQMLPESIHDR